METEGREEGGGRSETAVPVTAVTERRVPSSKT